MVVRIYNVRSDRITTTCESCMQLPPLWHAMKQSYLDLKVTASVLPRFTPATQLPQVDCKTRRLTTHASWRRGALIREMLCEADPYKHMLKEAGPKKKQNGTMSSSL